MEKRNIFKDYEVLQHRYYQIPKELFINSKYINLSLEAKLIYSFLLDRMELSRTNNWVNENREIYLIFTRKHIQEMLHLSDKPVTRAFKELINVALIYEEKQGFGKPNLIYIAKMEYSTEENSITESENIRPDNRKNSDSLVGENTIIESENVRTNDTNINNTNNIYTNKNNPNLPLIETVEENFEVNQLELIKNNCALNSITDEDDRYILDKAITTMYNAETIKVGSNIINQGTVREILKKLDYNLLSNILTNFKNADTSSIKDKNKYLISCIYNYLNNYDSNSKYKNNKKGWQSGEQRQYPDGFFDQFYANLKTTGSLQTS